MSEAVRTLRLKPKAERRVAGGRPWVYSNEIAGKLGGCAAGEVVDVESHGGEFLGRGHLSPNSLIAVRLFARERLPLDRQLFAARMRKARGWRERALPGRAMRREVHGEADGLPGLVIDRYGETLVLQLRTAGVWVAREELVAAAREVYAPRAVVLAVRGAEEGLEEKVEPVLGDVPDPLWVSQDGIEFPVDVLKGQKTGFFLDQEENRRRIAALSKDRHLLDVFSYTSALALHALAAGARHVTLVDASERALSIAEQALARNGFSARATLLRADAFEALAPLAAEGKRFEVVSTDPPALAKSAKYVRQAERGYRKLAELALGVLQGGGVYAASSCSFHVGRERFALMLGEGLRRAGREGALFEYRGAAPDHPLHPLLPESDYLKCALLAVE